MVSYKADLWGFGSQTPGSKATVPNSTQSNATAFPDINWDEYRKWLQATHTTSNSTFNLARAYKDALFDTRKAAQLQALSYDKRRHIMASLANLAKFTGRYEEWKQVMKQAGLK